MGINELKMEKKMKKVIFLLITMFIFVDFINCNEIVNDVEIFHETNITKIMERMNQQKFFKMTSTKVNTLAEKGDVLAQIYLALKSIDNNVSQTIFWLDKAELSGVVFAKYELGVIYQYHIKDLDKAIEWYKKAAKHKMVEAYYALGSIEEDRGVSSYTSLQYAFNWYKKAALLGETKSQVRLALMYLVGNGINKNFQQAYNWTYKAALKGNEQAEAMLGTMYYYGKGMPVNYNESFYWFQQAANKNYSMAQYSIGLFYCEGSGMKQNLHECAYWLKKAYKNGFDVSRVWNRYNLSNY